jgi:hypothetical protein
MKPIYFRISVCLSVSAIILAVSCTKNIPPPPGGSGGGGTPNPANGSFLTSIKHNIIGVAITDSFTYDNSNRLISIALPGNNGGQTTTFSYSGSNTVPASYTVKNSLLPNNQEVHQLWYDGQNRIVKDSTISGGNGGGVIHLGDSSVVVNINNAGNVTYYTYPQGNIATLTTGKTGAAGGQIIDTFYLSNGNVASLHSLIIGAAGAPQGTVADSTQYTYNTIVNPQFHQSIASTWGPLLTNLGGYDAVSGYGVNTATNWSTVGNLPTTKSTQNHSWTLDGKGRGATETVSDPKVGVVDNLTFTYNN